MPDAFTCHIPKSHKNAVIIDSEIGFYPPCRIAQNMSP